MTAGGRFSRLGILLGVALALVALAASGCGRSTTRLTVLGGSELKDLEPLLGDVQKHTGIKLEFDYVGTLDGTERIMSGQDNHDLAWFSHSKYLELLQQESGKHYVQASEKIMLSPVVLGVKRSVAARLGWSNGAVTWRDIALAAKRGKLRFAMTNPASSNSGFTALVGVASAFAGSADALNAGQIDTQALKDFFAGQKLTAGSSGFLADAFVGAQDSLDGMVNYESVLLSLNESGKLHEPLQLIYPREGIITADYPLLLLNAGKRDVYDKLVAYLRTPGFQEKLMKTTLRRPSVPGVPLDPRLPHALLVELPFPSSARTIDQILLAYLNEARPPAHATFVLDTSGSMADNGKIVDLRRALSNLAGLDTTLTGRFSHFHQREELTFIPFNSQVLPQADFVITDTDPNGLSYRQIRTFVAGLQPGGGTAIYRALQYAYLAAGKAQRASPGRYYSIVLMTDGLNNDDVPTVGDFERFYARLPAVMKRIRTFTVVFGDADQTELEHVAELTGGRVFDARSASLTEIFKEIRGYQ